MLTFLLVGRFFRLMEILASQFRAARALLGKRQEDVAAWLKLDRQEVGRWETAKYKLLSSEADKLKKAYDTNGILFFPASDGRGAGVRWRAHGTENKHQGAQFRAARAMANLSMRQLHELAQVDRNFTTRLERGKFALINVETVRELERFFQSIEIDLVPETDEFGAGVRWMVTEPRLLTRSLKKQ